MSFFQPSPQSDGSVDLQYGGQVVVQPQQQQQQQVEQLLATPEYAEGSGGDDETPTSLHWFRMDALRLHDNPAFTKSLSLGMRFKAVFIINPWFNANYTGGPSANVWRFLLECLHDIDFQLQKVPFNTRLHVLVGHPLLILPQIFKKWNVKVLTFQASQTSYNSMHYDSIIKAIGKECQVEVHSVFSHTLYNPMDVISFNDGQVPITYKLFRQIIQNLGKPREPLGLPTAISILNHAPPGGELEQPLGNIPTLQDLGFEASEALYTNPWAGGETEALCRLLRYGMSRIESQNDTLRWLLSKDSLSPYIRFGCLSVCQVFNQLQQFASVSTRGQQLFRQTVKNLLLRDFAYLVSSTTPKFDTMEGNNLCIQLPWDTNEEFLSAWQEGRTGYPWIDAIVRQCRKDGWAHFMARQSIAVFLTRGYLWISWVLGKDFFHKYMLDFELPVSTVCWMQSSCSGFFCNQVESFDPCLIGKKMDMNGIFIKAYVPELANFPSEYIHYPWKAPLYIQEQAGCVIGSDYPQPIVDICEQGQLCCKRIHSIMSSLHQVYSQS